MQTNNVDFLEVENVRFEPTRDGLDIVSSRHVWINNIYVAGGGDDALVFKSDFALGLVLQSYNVTVINSNIR